MKASTPIRIDADLYSAATTVAPVMSRSTAQQIAHWARIGRELEASSEVSVDAVAEVLRGAETYDTLGTEEQAIVRAYWAERMSALLEALRLDQEFAAEGRAYVEVDETGAIVRRDPGSISVKRRTAGA
jgi:hypothetical protein